VNGAVFIVCKKWQTKDKQEAGLQDKLEIIEKEKV
jgi:hypothetical protein